MIYTFNSEEKARKAEQIAADYFGCPKDGCETNGLCEKHPKDDKWLFQIFPEHHSAECIADIAAIADGEINGKAPVEWDHVKANVK